VFLSHLHFDHTHNVDLFPRARSLVSRREWIVASLHPDDLLVPWGICDQLEKGGVELIEGEGQLEPGITFFPAPGHTPGCYAIELKGGDGVTVVVRDTIKYVKEVILRRCDMAFDPLEAGTVMIGRILDRADRIVSGHFSELIRQPNGAFS
jgi:glyoxylase-like metal-dependent hydrolase (beta-lactamase superfamily II)